MIHPGYQEFGDPGNDVGKGTGKCVEPGQVKRMPRCVGTTCSDGADSLMPSSEAEGMNSHEL